MYLVLRYCVSLFENWNFLFSFSAWIHWELQKIFPRYCWVSIFIETWRVQAVILYSQYGHVHPIDVLLPDYNVTIDLHCVCRFFVVEDHILSTTQGLVNRAYMDELWEMSVSKLAASLRTSAVRICWFLAVFLRTTFNSFKFDDKINYSSS